MADLPTPETMAAMVLGLPSTPETLRVVAALIGSRDNLKHTEGVKEGLAMGREAVASALEEVARAAGKPELIAELRKMVLRG